MRALPQLAARTAMVLLAAGSVAWAALPVARHAAGIVVIEPLANDAPLMPSQARATDLTPLFERAPFGRAAVPEHLANPTAATLPRVTLRGVFVADPAAASAALLDVDGTLGRFHVAAQVTPTLTLAQVARDSVTLVGAARQIVLYFDDDAEMQDTAPTEAPALSTPQDLVARLGSGLVVPSGYAAPKAPQTTSEYIDYWRRRIQKNPQAVLQEIGLTPTENGYVIAERHDVGVKLAGLRSGDLVRTVNGQAVGNPDDDRRFYDRIAAAGQARLEVERNGRVLTFSFPLR